MISFLILSGRSFYFHATARPHKAIHATLTTPPHQASIKPASATAARPHKAIHAPTPRYPHQASIKPASATATARPHPALRPLPRHRRRAEKQHRNEVK